MALSEIFIRALCILVIIRGETKLVRILLVSLMPGFLFRFTFVMTS